MSTTPVLGLKNDWVDQDVVLAAELILWATSIEGIAAGVGTVSVAGGATVTLLAAQYGLQVVRLQGLLTASINVVFPTAARRWIVVNETTGAFAVTCKTAAGTGVVVAQGYAALLRGDGINISRCGLDVTDGGAALGLGDLNFAGGYRIPLDGWYYDNAAPSLAAALMLRSPATGMPSSWVAVRAGSLTGLGIKSNAVRTAGTLTAEVYLNGAATGLTAVLDATHTSKNSTLQAKDTTPFVAGDELDVRITTTGAWLPVTADVRATVEIET